MRWRWLRCGRLLLGFSVMWALPGTVTSAPQAGCSPSAGCLLQEGTPIPLKFAADLSSKTAEEGDAVTFVLADDLKVGGSTVIAKGASAVGMVTSAKKAGLIEKAGALGLRLEYLIAGSERVRIRGTPERDGKSQWKERNGSSHSPLILIKHGKNVDRPAGTPLTAYVDQDVWLVPIR